MELENKVVCSYQISKMDARNLYEVICMELSFNKVIELYELLKFKMEYLEDKPIPCVSYKLGKEDN